MNNLIKLISLALCINLALALTNICSAGSSPNPDEAAEEVHKGPNNGRLLVDGDFVVELAVFETGLPPEFRVWVTKNDKKINPDKVKIKVVLSRLGNIQDHINFTAQDDFLRGDIEIYEPHSFHVALRANYQGAMHEWQYDNFEGRTKIEEKVAQALEIKTSMAKSETLKETIKVYGKLAVKPENIRNISARFAGVIKKLNVSLGQVVEKGQSLMSVENNESLRVYTIYSPIKGVIQSLNANSGEQTGNNVLMEIVDNSSLYAELSVFPADREKVALNTDVKIKVKGHQDNLQGKIVQINGFTQANQSVIMRVDLANQTGRLTSGSFLTANIEIAQFEVDLAVRRTGLQSFRDFTVVYEKIGDEYEVRMLELGRVAGDWVEVLGGLKPGAQYVSENSYVIKADIEKSGASHDH